MFPYSICFSTCQPWNYYVINTMPEFVAQEFVDLLLVISKFLSSLSEDLTSNLYFGTAVFLRIFTSLLGSFRENGERENALGAKLW